MHSSLHGPSAGLSNAHCCSCSRASALMNTRPLRFSSFGETPSQASSLITRGRIDMFNTLQGKRKWLSFRFCDSLTVNPRNNQCGKRGTKGDSLNRVGFHTSSISVHPLGIPLIFNYLITNFLHHSYLSATSGSILVARRAGREQASMATLAINIGTRT